MLAITRFRSDQPEALTAQAEELLTLLNDCPGLRSAAFLRAVDEPEVYALVTRWDGAGSYRHALGRVDVRMILLPMSMAAIDEPGAFEELLSLTDQGEVSRGDPAVVDGPWLSTRETTDGDWVK